MIRGFAKTSSSVFECAIDPVVVSDLQVKELIAAAAQSANGRARLLLHPTREDLLHEMVIALPPESCDHPHINYKSGKSFLALSGQFAVMCCSQDGSHISAIVLSAGDWPGGRLARLCAPTWHTIIPLAGNTVFLETIIGPFTGNQFAEWFPREGAEQKAFADRLRSIAQTTARQMSRN